MDISMTLDDMMAAGIPDSCEHCEFYSDCNMATECRIADEWLEAKNGQ